MKKKLPTTLLALTAACTLTFTACDFFGGTSEHKHSYTETVVEPTCTQQGYTLHTCIGCKDSYKDKYTEVIDHPYNESVVQPTCTEKGYTLYTCPECGAHYTGNETKTVPHSYTESTVPPNCTEQGYILHTCSECGDNYKGAYTAEIVPDAHTYEDYVCKYCYDVDPDAPETEGLEYTLNSDNQSYGVSKIGTADGKFVKIPSFYDDKPVTSIKNKAFANCESLKGVVIPETVTYIAQSAFWFCSSLVSINIPQSVTYLGPSAFYGCDCLTSITIPKGVTEIGNYTFSSCDNLTSVTLPYGITSIGQEAFRNTNLTSITIPDSVTTIKRGAFGNCTNLFRIENGLRYVDKWVVGYVKGVTEVTFLDDTKGIACAAFDDCSTLEKITIPNGVTHINDETFSYCTALTSVTIPNSVTYIGYNVFWSCSSLTGINFIGTKDEWTAITKNSDLRGYTVTCTGG